MSVQIPYNTLSSIPLNTEDNIYHIEDIDIPIQRKNKEEDFLGMVSAFAGIKVGKEDKNAADELYQSMVMTFIDEAHVALTTRFQHLRNVDKKYLMETSKVKTMFAKLVALCMRTSQTTSGNQYELDKIYMRINLEKKKVMNYFRNIRPTPLLNIAMLDLNDLNPIGNQMSI